MTIQKTFCLLALAGVAFLPLSVGATTYTNTGVSGSVEVNVGGGTSAGATGTGSAGTADDGDTSTSSDAGMGSDAGLTGGLNTNGLGVEIMSSAQVTSDSDLQIFADNLKIRDENVAEAHAEATGSADLEYYHEGRLFGVIPVKLKSHTWVTNETDGTLKVNTTLPWWSAFVTGTGNVRSNVDSELSTSSSLAADMRATADAKARARVLEAIASAHASASLEAAAE